MRLPRDLSGDELAELLRLNFGYRFVRQRGSHMTLAVVTLEAEHHVTIPRHQEIRVGTLSSIISDVAEHFGLTRDEVRMKLFQR